MCLLWPRTRLGVAGEELAFGCGARRRAVEMTVEQSGGSVRDLGVGAAVGYSASMAMDRATGWYLRRQGETSRRREREVAPGGTPVLAGRRLADLAGRSVTDAEAARIGSVVHRALGMTYGATVAALARAGASPFVAGVATGVAAFVVVDEAVMSAYFTPPPWAYPLESHLRGLVGHLAYGAVAGTLIAGARRLGAV